MAAEWYYTVGDVTWGPVSFSYLQQLAAAGKLTTDSLVHREGIDVWALAGTVDGLSFPQSATDVRNIPDIDPSAALADSWYLRDEKQWRGPYEFSELQWLAVSGQLQTGDVIWTAGMTEGARAGTIEGLTFGKPEPDSPTDSGIEPTPKPGSFLGQLLSVLLRFLCVAFAIWFLDAMNSVYWTSDGEVFIPTGLKVLFWILLTLIGALCLAGSIWFIRRS